MPVQSRSRETFERILDAAITLLERDGWNGFNTNSLAEQAGCRVSALYRYFPNKESVLLTLTSRALDEWRSWYEDFETDLAVREDFIVVWHAYIDKFVAGIRNMPGGMAVRKAMLASPELYEIDRQDTQDLARRLAEVMLVHFDSLDRTRSELVASMLLDSAALHIDEALTLPFEKAQTLLSELKQMHASYIRSFSNR